MTDKLFPGVSAVNMAKKQEKAVKKTEEEMAARAEKEVKAGRAQKLKHATRGMRNELVLGASGVAALVSAVAAAMFASSGAGGDFKKEYETYTNTLGKEWFREVYVPVSPKEKMLDYFLYIIVSVALMAWAMWEPVKDIRVLRQKLKALQDINLDDVSELEGFVNAHDKFDRYYGVVDMVLEIIEGLSKNDRAYFDKMMANPNDIKSQEMFIAVIKGHLKTHPRDLDKLFNAFDPASIPDEIRTAYEKERKNRTVSWDQALEQYKQNMAHTK